MIEINLEQYSNILFVLKEDEAWKFEIFKKGIDWQLLNIRSISVTFDVSKFDTFNEVIFGHNSNICLIFLTKGVWKLETSNVTSSLQLLNMFCISVTL